MTKTAIIDSKLITQEVEKTERTNLLISNSKIIGVGYIPDDEGCNKIEANGYYTINAVTNIDSNYSAEIKAEAKSAGITHWITPSSEPSHEADCILESSANTLNFIENAETTQTPCLVALNSLTSDLTSHTYTHTTFSIPGNAVISDTKNALKLLIEKKATHIHLTPPFSDTSIHEINEALKSTFSLRDIAALLSFNSWTFLQKKPDSISLLRSPNFTLYSPTKTPHILGTF